MSAGAFSDDKAVKAAAKNVIAVYVDCTEDDQNAALQKKYKIEGFPTLLIVSPDEKILEDWYPTEGGKLAADLARVGKKYGPRPFMSTWTDALTYGKEDKKTVVVFYIRDKNYKRWNELKDWLQKKLGKDFGKFIFARSLPGTDERKAFDGKLGKNKDRVSNVVILNTAEKNPFAKPGIPFELDGDKLIEAIRKTARKK